METVIDNNTIKKYPAYMDSGIEWIEDVPDHWEVKKFKRVFYEIKKRSNPELNCGSISFGKVVYKDDEKIPESTKKSYQVVLKGDFLVNPLNLNYDLISLRIALSEIDVVVSSGYIVMGNSVKIDKTYYKYFLHRFDVAFMKLLGSGVRQTLNWNDIANCDLIFPPLPEQTAIAAFLDRKTALIDQAIGIKQKQIELLKERRQILIHKAVTRGLNPNVKLKDSGVEWIREIPEGWKVKKLRYLANCFPSNVDKHSKPNEKEVRLCNYTDVYKNDYITDDMELMMSTASDEQIAKYTLREGDIVITKDSETASDIAVPTFIKEELTNVVCGYHLAVIRTYHSSYSRYLFQALKTKLFNAQFEICSNGITRVGLGNSDLRNGYFLLPPEDEQIKISDFIEAGTSKIATAISLKEQEIEKLKEYKASLINSAVTGKIKVC
jgi:type I restriction enzyme S subunit